MSLNVLVTAGSRRVALVRAFHRALADLGVFGTVIVADVNPMSPAVHIADRAYRVPLANHPSYVDQIAAICQRERIGLIVPTIDDELPLFGGMRDAFQAMGVRVAASAQATAELCDDKFDLCRYLRTRGLPAAESYLPAHLPAALAPPLFIKPRRGRGSVGAYTIRTRRELDFFLEYVNDPVVQEFLDGAEYTIDMLCDFDGRPLSIVPRERVVIRSGVTDRGRTTDDRSLIDLAMACASTLPFAGAVNIQCRMTARGPVIFEINPRFSGGIPLTIAAGADFPRMLVELALGRRVHPQIGRFRAGLWMTSYESSLFLPDGAASLLEPHGVGEPVIKEVA